MPLVDEGWSFLKRLCPPLLHLYTPLLHSLLSLPFSPLCLGPWAIPDKHSETKPLQKSSKIKYLRKAGPEPIRSDFTVGYLGQGSGVSGEEDA